jgi:hypothetical protein
MCPGAANIALNESRPKRWVRSRNCTSASARLENRVCNTRAQPQARMFFTFPENIRWDPERQAVEFRVEIGEYEGVVRVARHVLQRLLPERPRPERCVEAYYLQRTRFESITERKLRRRQLTEDGNVEITGRDLRGGPAAAPRSARS